MIDLHTHTNFSDGIQSLEQLLLKAEASNLKYISITDHDSIDAYIEMSKINKDLYTGKLITGTEIYFVQDGIFNELLGYNFDVEKISKSFIFDKNLRQQQELEFLNELYPKLKKKGFNLLSKKEYETKILTSNTFAATECGRALFDIEENRKIREEYGIYDWSDYFSKWINNENGDMFIDALKYKPDMKTVSEVIRESGGLVFMAHIFRKSDKEAKFLLNYAVENKLIDGIEVYYKTHTKEQIEYLLGFCKKHNLYISGGTDAHDLDQKLGIIETGNIPDNIINDWE